MAGRRDDPAVARELVETACGNVTIDWTLLENIRIQLRVMVRRILRKYGGYPPNKQEKTVLTVLEQAEVLSEGGRPPEALRSYAWASTESEPAPPRSSFRLRSPATGSRCPRLMSA